SKSSSSCGTAAWNGPEVECAELSIMSEIIIQYWYCCLRIIRYRCWSSFLFVKNNISKAYFMLDPAQSIHRCTCSLIGMGIAAGSLNGTEWFRFLAEIPVCAESSAP